MARTKKVRTVCECLLGSDGERGDLNREGVLLSVDELESIRLADLEGLEQSICAERMGVSRGTFQRVLYEARKKVAYGIVSGIGIRLEGTVAAGDVSAGECGDSEACRYCGRRLNDIMSSRKGQVVVAIGCLGEEVSERLESSDEIRFFQISDGCAVRSWSLSPVSSCCDELVSCLVGQNVDVLFCGSIAGEYRMALAGHGIVVSSGVSGLASSVVSSYVSGRCPRDGSR